MEEQGLWDLFWVTGLPEAWLNIRRVQEPEERPCALAPGETDDL